ncbi:Fpg/Nei family DNA glycosylase [Actinoplanes sp. NPDC049265]|uniref:Fpg/Nei family DNA glycosylase n=1 Tax=Actinoplanes sp. NPDC049265 TaxID=3363902 RepID=UPI003712CFC4
MPEGHTIHRLAARHRELFGGGRVAVSSPQGRFAAGAALVDGREFAGAEAYGKHLLHRYDGGLWVHVHLGLYGKVSDGALPAPAPVGQVRMRMAGDAHWLDLRGPTACEVFDQQQVGELIARLGADPLRGDSENPREQVLRSARPVFALLLDQSIVAGCGLIYANEVLFRAGVAPTTPGREVAPERWDAMWTDLRELMREGVVKGWIDTVHTAHTPEAMRRAPRVDRHGGEVYVYRRPGQPCHVCGTAVARGELAARNLFWCPSCQRPDRPSPPAARRARTSR